MMALSQPDPSLAFPQNTVLAPRLFLRNAGPASLPVSLAVDWRSQNASGTYQFPPLHLKPGELRTVELGKAQASGLIPENAHWGTARVSYAGKSADLVPVAFSYDSTNRYGLQTPFTEGTSRLFKGSMWHVDPTHNTLLTTGNGGSEATTAQVTLFYNGGQGRYRVEKVLQPGQQLWLDVGQLIHNQVPDSDGNTLPPDTMTGSYELRDLDHAAVGLLYEGKLIIDKTYGHASYGCGTCCGYVKAQVWVTPFSGPPSINNTDYYQAEEQCGGAWDDFTSIATSWQSSNTAVATLPSRTLHTVAPGTATGSAEAYLQGSRPAPACPMIWMAGQQQLNVQPHISSVDPTIATIGSNGVQITINGSGFGTTPTVNLPGGFSNTGQASSNTRIVVTVNIGYAATVGNNSISVTGPTGTSNSASFTANGPSMMIVQQNGDVIGTTTNDPTAQSRFVTYQVQNVDKTAAANIPIAEVICSPSSTHN